VHLLDVIILNLRKKHGKHSIKKVFHHVLTKHFKMFYGLLKLGDHWNHLISILEDFVHEFYVINNVFLVS
jgi:hypothetical protein